KNAPKKEGFAVPPEVAQPGPATEPPVPLKPAVEPKRGGPQPAPAVDPPVVPLPAQPVPAPQPVPLPPPLPFPGPGVIGGGGIGFPGGQFTQPGTITLTPGKADKVNADLATAFRVRGTPA